jgi:predicted dehydrogenase
LEYRIGIIGTGRIAWQFDESKGIHPASIAGAFSLLPNAKLVAASSRGRERMEAFGRKYGVSALYQDYREMLRKEELDVVAITTHPPLHPEQVVAVAEAGVKGIFCEKPMALSLAECDVMLDACDKAGVTMLVNCTRRWDGRYEAARQVVQSGSMGELLHISARWNGCKPIPEWEAQTEGPMLHDAVHLFDLMRFYAGEVEWVIGTATKRKRKEYPVEDTAEAIFQFRNGVDGVVVVDELTEYSEADMELQFERGVIRLGVEDGTWASRMSEFERPWWYQLDRSEMQTPPWTDPPLLVAARDMLECMDTGRQPRCNGRDGRAAIEIIMGIYESARRGNEKVQFPVENKERMAEVLHREGKL